LLYLIEYLCHIKVELLYQAFRERVEMFENIRDYFGANNRKISDLANSIVCIFNPEQKKTINSSQNTEKVDLVVL
jgi:hypothetical protein